MRGERKEKARVGILRKRERANDRPFLVRGDCALQRSRRRCRGESRPRSPHVRLPTAAWFSASSVTPDLHPTWRYRSSSSNTERTTQHVDLGKLDAAAPCALVSRPSQGGGTGSNPVGAAKCAHEPCSRDSADAPIGRARFRYSRYSHLAQPGCTGSISVLGIPESRPPAPLATARETVVRAGDTCAVSPSAQEWRRPVPQQHEPEIGRSGVTTARVRIPLGDLSAVGQRRRSTFVGMPPTPIERLAVAVRRAR